MTGYILPQLLQTTPELNDVHIQVFFLSLHHWETISCVWFVWPVTKEPAHLRFPYRLGFLCVSFIQRGQMFVNYH